MKIAVIGAGSVGSTLAAGWKKANHEVVLGVRDPAKAPAGADARPVAKAAAEAEVVVLCVPGGAAAEVTRSLGDLGAKVLIDCTNPIGPGLTLTTGFDSSGGELVAAAAKNARVVKCFNTTGYENMANPDYDGTPATMFLCGDDGDAKVAVAGLAADLGFEPVDVGDLEMARHLEPLAMVWIHLARVRGPGPDIAFKVLRR